MGYLGVLMAAVSFVFMLVALIPFLGWLNWFLTPFALVSLIISLIGAIRGSGRVLGIIGTIVCFGVLIVSALRLIVGGGII